MTTSHNYYRTDMTAIQAALYGQLSTSYMRTNVSSNWRGWRDASQELDLGAFGSIEAQACGAIWLLQESRSPLRVGDKTAPWARDYFLTIYFRRQADPTSLDIVHTFDETLKARLANHWNSNAEIEPYDLSAPWDVQDIAETWIDTVHAIRFQMVN